MKTRTLILLAMACGLAILVAGGAFLWRVIANKDELTVPDIRGVGESQQVGPVTATPTTFTITGDTVRVDVHLESVEPLGDAGTGWALLVDGDLEAPLAVAPGGTPGCAGTALASGQPLDCSLAFRAGDGDRYLGYAVGDVQRQWKLEPPLP